MDKRLDELNEKLIINLRALVTNLESQVEKYEKILVLDSKIINNLELQADNYKRALFIARQQYLEIIQSEFADTQIESLMESYDKRIPKIKEA